MFEDLNRGKRMSFAVGHEYIVTLRDKLTVAKAQEKPVTLAWHEASSILREYSDLLDRALAAAGHVYKGIR